MKQKLEIDIVGHVLVKDAKTKEVLLDKCNAIHTTNMARIIGRGLAHEPNYYIYRMAFGNGGTFVDAGGQTVIRPPNDGNNGDGWESRLYNETYSEVIDEESAEFETGPGAVPSNDPAGGGIISQEVGTKTNVIVTVYLNESEPSGELSNSSQAPLSGAELDFRFDEIGLYSFGLPAQATNGVSSVNVGDKISTDDINLPPNSILTLQVTVDGVAYTSEITVPASGTGPSNSITFGDFCEGINSGLWITGGDLVNSVLYVYITDYSGGAYPSIIGKQSYGYLTFESKTTGSTSTITLTCDDGDASNIFNVMTSGICGNTNVNQEDGENAGVQNDPSDPAIERERLLTHLIFDPLLKAADRAFEIIYTLTISVSPSQDSVVSVNFVN